MKLTNLCIWLNTKFKSEFNKNKLALLEKWNSANAIKEMIMF